MNKLSLLLLLSPCCLLAQNSDIIPQQGWGDDIPELSSLVNFARSESDLRVALIRYVEDKAAIKRRYEVLLSPTRIERLTEFYLGWQTKLKELSFGDMNHEGQVDYIALRNRIEYDLEAVRLDQERGRETRPDEAFPGGLFEGYCRFQRQYDR